MGPITQEQVFNSAQLIARQGEMPTIAAIRVMLGGRGSETTILNHLSKWKARLLQFAAMLADSEVNPDLCICTFDENITLKRQLYDLQNLHLTIKIELDSAKQKLKKLEENNVKLNLQLTLREQQLEQLHMQIRDINQIGLDKVIEASQANHSQLALERAHNILLKEKICIIKQDLKELQGTHTLL